CVAHHSTVEPNDADGRCYAPPMRRLFVAAAPLAVFAACTAFSSSGDSGGSADGGSEAPAGEAAPPADAPPEAAGDAGAGVDDFESKSDCNPWFGNGAVLTVAAGGANGSGHACRVRASASNGDARRTYDVAP